MSFKVERLCNDHGVLLCGRVLAEREVNFRGTPCFSEQQEERRANMNEDILKGKWKEIKGAEKEKWGKLTDDDLTVNNKGGSPSYPRRHEGRFRMGNSKRVWWCLPAGAMIAAGWGFWET